MGRLVLWVVAIVIAGFASSAIGGQVQPEATRLVAIVEDISAPRGLDRFDLVLSGQRIDLGEKGCVVLGFFTSCWQESIVGGRVFVEDDRSRVEGGEITRRRVECDPSAFAKLNSGGALTGRAVVPLAEKLREPDVVLFGRSPVALSHGADPFLVIERLDVPGPPLRLEFRDGRIDLLERRIDLDAKGLYRFESGGSSIIARVDELAEPGPAPVVGRLLVFY